MCWRASYWDNSLLYGPSLTGRKVLLPLDCLAFPGSYLANTLQTPNHYQDLAPLDLVLQFEPDRRFAMREIAAGRFPLWTPNHYGGVPFICAKYSPFFLFKCLAASPGHPRVGATSRRAGCRHGRLFILPARDSSEFLAGNAGIAWCYPMTGFLFSGKGYPTCAPVYWLPWLLFAVDRTVRGNRIAPAALALVTGLVLVSGHIDVAALVLLVSGMFALWCLREVHGRQIFGRQAGKAALILTLGWGLGFLLAAPNILPVMEYARTGHRMSERFNGSQERPPVGLAALPQVVLPDMYGSTQKGSFPLFPEGQRNLPESSAAAYAGVLATLLAAPLAWCSRRHRSLNRFWILLAVLGLSWCLDLPGVVDCLSLPGVNLLSYNRLVFATAFAILALTSTGLEAMLNGECQWRRGFWLPAALLAGLGAWCLYRAEVLPEPLATQFETMVRADIRLHGSKMLTAYDRRRPGLHRTIKCQPRGVARAWWSGWFFGLAG